MKITRIEELKTFDASFLDKHSRARIEEVLRCRGSAWIFRTREEINDDTELRPDEKMGCRLALIGAVGVYRARMKDGGGFIGELPNSYLQRTGQL